LAFAASSSGVNIFFLRPGFFGPGAGATTPRLLALTEVAVVVVVVVVDEGCAEDATPEKGLLLWRETMLAMLGGVGKRVAARSGDPGGVLSGSDELERSPESSS
jgi:hypothetical protein